MTIFFDNLFISARVYCIKHISGELKMIDEGTKEFMDKKPNVKVLRKEHPNLANLLKGEFAKNSKADISNDNSIIAWNLMLNKVISASYVRFSQGSYEIKTDEFGQRLTVLNGSLNVQIDGGKVNYNLKKYELAVIPSKCNVKFKAEAPVHCLREYVND